VPQKNSSRDFKVLLGKDSSHLKAKTKLNSQPVAVLTLAEYEVLIAKLDRQGNKLAQDFRDSLVGLSLTQLFSDAFNIEFEKEHRQQYLIWRQESKKMCKELAHEIESWFEATKAERSRPIENYFSTSFDAINRGLFDKTSKKIKEELGIPKSALVRDDFSNQALVKITLVQELAAANMRNIAGARPVDAVKMALDSLQYPKMPYSNN